MKMPSSPNVSTTTNRIISRRSTTTSASPRSTMLGRPNYQAGSFVPPPFAASAPGGRAPSTSSQHRNPPPPPPPRRSSVGHTSTASSNCATGSSQAAYRIIRITLQRPMGIVFAPNGELGYGVRIIDLPQQGAAAKSKQLCVGDALVSVNEIDCTMSNSKEVLAMIGQAEGNVDLAFLRTSTAGAAAPSSAAENDMHQEPTQKIKVVNMKWQDIPSRQIGRYSGIVNQHMRPNGFGKFTSDQGQSLEGEWNSGLLTTSSATGTAMSNQDAADAAAYRRDLKRQNSNKSSASSLHSQSKRNEGMSYATTFSAYQDAQHQQQQLDHGHSTIQDNPIQHYCLGETLRSPEHMVQSPSVEDTIQSVYALQVSDFAFIKRSGGDWTFCQLVERGDNDEGEDVMTFCVNEVGHRKNLRPARWVEMVRSCSNGVAIRPGNDLESIPSF